MKKLKKLLAGVLTLAMAMSMMTMTAFASEATRPTGPTIPDSGEGSLTIHKLKKDDSIKTWPDSTGDVLELPGGSQPLEGVDFEIYLVETDLSKFYNTEPTDSLFQPTTYYTKGEDNTLKVKDASGSPINDPTDKGTTKADGTVKFDGLALGLYLVIEPAKAGSVVSAPVAPFLVSIPMTNSAGTGWLYDVHVYPKNATDQMDDNIVLIKYGKTAGEDDTKKVPLGGVDFVLQRKDEKTNKWITITKGVSASGKVNEGADLNLTTADGTEEADKGTISVSGLSVGEYRFIESDLGDNNGYIMDGATTYKFEIKRDAEEKLYVIYGSDDEDAPLAVELGGTLYKKIDTSTLEDTAEDPRFVVMNEKPDFDKQIMDGDTPTTDSSEHSVGDIIDYQLEVSVPSKIAKMKTFQIVDTPNNLKDFNVKVYKGEDLVDAKYYKVTEIDGNGDGAKGFLLVFNTKEAGMDGYAGERLTVKYQAELLEGALTNVVNSNDAQLIYSTNTDTDEMDDDNPNKKKEEEIEANEQTAYAYSYKFKVVKYADKKSDEENDRGLNGVKFDLYKDFSDLTDEELEDHTILTDKDATALGLPSGKWEKIDELETDTVDGVKGIIIKGGLGNGTYYLVETKTAPTYNLLKEPVDVSLSLESKTEYTEGWEKKTITVYEEQEDGTWKAVEKAVSVYTKTTTEKTTYDKSTDEGVYTKEIINRKGFTLPSTGGMGTFLFTFVGVAMMAAAVILFFTSKKKEAK